MHREQRQTQSLARRRQARFPLRRAQQIARVGNAWHLLRRSLNRGGLFWLGACIVALTPSMVLLSGGALPAGRERTQSAPAPSVFTGRAHLQARLLRTYHWMDVGNGT